MNRISCGNLNRLLSTLRWLPWSLITIRHLLLRSIGTMYGPTSCDRRYSPLSSFSLWGGYFLPGPQVLSSRVNFWRRSLITFRRLPLFLNSLPALQAQPYMCSQYWVHSVPLNHQVVFLSRAPVPSLQSLHLKTDFLHICSFPLDRSPKSSDTRSLMAECQKYQEVPIARSKASQTLHVCELWSCDLLSKFNCH